MSSEFRVWSPTAKTLSVVIEGKSDFPLTQETGTDYFSATIPAADFGDQYRFRVNDGDAFPDPRSRYQPEGVHGPSQLVDPNAYQWQDQDWSGIAREDLAIYEIHVGTFTENGTFLATIDRLDELVELGVNTLEIMPVIECPGQWNWGYDGVNLYAPSHNYGTPDDFKSLVDACHAKGIAVILDVVYNHIGPEGNYLLNFGPYFSKQHQTPWGDAFNFDEKHSTEVRNFIRENVLYWLNEFHLDGLRLDAVRFLFDDSEVSIVEEISTDVKNLRPTLKRPIHLIGECCIYDQALLDNGYDIVWSDEIPHSVLGLALNQTEIAERIYTGIDDLQECLDIGYLYEWKAGEILRTSESKQRGSLAQIVHGLQTHDQVGNHPKGYRIHQQSSHEVQRAAAALTMLHPAIPFIFMGEEFATPSPFCFFVDYGDHWLRKAVVEGRQRDYAHHNWDEFISPLEEDTFLRSKLPARSAGDKLTYRWYQELLSIRKQWRAEGLLSQNNLYVEKDPDKDFIRLRYGCHWIAARLRPFGTDEAAIEPITLTGTVILHSESLQENQPLLGINQAAIGFDE